MRQHILLFYQFLIIESVKIALPSQIQNLNPQTLTNRKEDSAIRFKPKQKENIGKTNFPREDNIEAAVKYGFDVVEDLITDKEPTWYKMGLFLDSNHPGSKVAQFGKPNKRALKLSYFGLATLEATRKIVKSFPANLSRQLTDFPISIKSRVLEDECPLKGRPRCPIFSKTYRTYDGTCNNLVDPWKGAAMLPMQRFLPALYEDGIQSVRRSILGTRLPSAREISSRIHRDKNEELHVVTLMFMQWGQFIDHDITSVVKSRGFNGSVPRCCDKAGEKVLPLELLHPSCLPIDVPEDDWFFGKFGIGCMEFLRSAPSTRVNCDLGWREQINKVTSFIDASMIYGSDIEMADSIRTFRNGKILYGRPRGDRPLQPPDPPGGELCSSGALTTDCFQPGDGRVMEQPGLTALHTVWIRFHNQVASQLARFNIHWSDEKLYQETRKIVYSLIQHITYKEFLPVLLGPEVMRLFELELLPKGFYKSYDSKINPTIANAFSTAAYRFGHSMVQNSFVRTDEKHRPIFNNVSLHDEFTNLENIWSFGSVDRTLLGFCNQPAQRRDEFVCDELSNHLFQPPDLPFGMDLTAINIQRGRDHGIPPYTSWREPCGLADIRNWEDLEKAFNIETVRRFRKVYRHVEDIDLFSGGLAEKPVRGAVVGPTFSCIIAQQFNNLRKGDRFWYENGHPASSFTPAQLQQIRKVTLSSILCHTMDEIETIQPFAFLTHDKSKNKRLFCTDSILKNLDLNPWIETIPNEVENKLFSREGIDILDDTPSNNKRLTKLEYKRKKKPNITVNNTKNIFIQESKEGDGKRTTPSPLEVNIKISYYPQAQNPISNIKKKVSNYQPSQIYQSEKPITTPIFVQSPIVQTNFNPLIHQNSYDSPNDYNLRPSNDQSSYGSALDEVQLNYNRQTVLVQSTYNSRPQTNYNSRPSIVQSTYNSPPASRPTFVIGRPTSSAVDYNPYDYRPTQMFNRPTADSYESPNYKPSSSDEYDDVVFEDRPFSSSFKKPYKPLNNHFLYNEVYSTIRPVQNTYDEDIIGNFYQKYASNYIKEKFANKLDTPTKVYSTGYVHRLDGPDVSDKLDFKSRLVSKKKNKDEGKFVKISSIKSHANVAASSAIINTVLQREGDVEISDEDADMMRLVEMDISPSDVDDKNWLIFEETEDKLKLIMPNISCQSEATEEIPQPIINWNKNSKNKKPLDKNTV